MDRSTVTLAVRHRGSGDVGESPPGAPSIAGTHGANLRVGMLAPCPFPSHQGTQVFIRHLVNALATGPVDVALFVYALEEKLSGLWLDPRVRLERAGGEHVGMRSGPSWSRVAGDASLMARAFAWVRRGGVDVLHAHNAEGLVMGVALSKALDLPLVYHAHNVLEHELPLYANHRVTRGAARLAAMAFDRSLPRQADVVICFDERQADYYAGLGVARGKLRAIPLALDHGELTSRSPPPERVSGGTHPRVVYAGNPDAYQNPLLLREAFTALRHREPGAVLRIVSNHPASAFGPLAEEPGVEVRGFAGPRELAALLAEADVGVCTRTLWTGSPVKILSYVSAGVPVVAVADGAAHLGDHPSAGRVVAAEPRAIAAALLEVATHRRSYDVSTLREATSIAGQIEQYVDVYRTAIAHHRSVRSRPWAHLTRHL